MQTLPLTGLALVLLTGAAAAQQPSQAQANAIRQSCRADYQSYCASVPTGGQASLQCLRQHVDSLSPACHDAVAAAGGGAAPHPSGTAPDTHAAAPPPMTPREEAELMRHACGNDFTTYCSDVHLGGGRGLACLMRNEQRLTPQCRGALAKAQEAQ